MRKTKRFAAAVAALAMAVSMVAASSTMTAFAAVQKGNLVVAETNQNTYKCYPIFVGNFQTVDGQKVLMSDSELALGEGVNADKFYEVLEVSGETDAEKVANALKAFDKKTTAEVMEILKEQGVLGTSSNLEKGKKAVDTGYYYIEETHADDAAIKGDILKIVDNTDVQIVTKVGKPKVEKKIQENVKEHELGNVIGEGLYAPKYSDTADFSIGDTVPFEIVGTMPENIGDYPKYYYRFNDRLVSGLTAPAPTAISVYKNTVSESTKIDSNSYQIKMADVDATQEAPAYKSISIIFNDIKAIAGGVDANTKIIVKYDAVLNANADMTSKGNTNDVDLTYTVINNYDGQGYKDDTQEDKDKEKEETDDTTKDGVVAFTYTVDVTKVDKDATATKLAGAEFVLGKGSGENTQYAVIDANNKFVKWTSDIDYNGPFGKVKFTTEADGKFVIAGLDDGEYYIRETEAPTGYNKLSNDIPVKISATLQTDGNWTYVNFDGTSAFRGVAEATDSTPFVPDDTVLKANVGNAKGAELPETGGIGTTMFYVGGGALAAVAGTVLIAKKRAKKED